MDPTIKNWNINPLDVGPIYPFVGAEMLMCAACAAFCAAFMIWKFRMETAKYASSARKLRRSPAFSKSRASDSANNQIQADAEQHRE